MDRDLLNALYRKYWDEIYLYLYSLGGNAHLAEDLAQETFLKALLALEEKHTNMRAWLYLVARNLYFNHRKKVRGEVPLEDMDETEAAGTQDVLERMIAEENQRMLYRALGRLERRKREILEMQYFGQLSQKEIAAVLRMTPENVRVLAYRAKRELRSYLEVAGYEIS